MSSREPVCDKFEQHPRRKLCANCRNPREEHAVDKKNAEQLLKGLDSLAKDAGAQTSPSNNVYSWVPLECPDDRLEEYFKEFPDEKVPKCNSEGDKWRLKQIMKQIPSSDVTESDSRFVENECKEDYAEHLKNIRKHALHIGRVKAWNKDMPLQCPTCLLLLEKNTLVVVPVEVSARAYHPKCFVCSVCNEQLVDLIYCSKVDGKIYCERHFSETKKKRCHACDELIFTNHFAQAGKTYYHKDHLRCFHCDELLANEKGYNKDGELYCVTCYEERFCSDCEKCGQRIKVDSRQVLHDDKSWHYNCFTCEKCKGVITEFKEHGGNIYCSRCYDEYFAPKCQECKKHFADQTKVVKYAENTYHVDCFKCAYCRESISTGAFVQHGEFVYCQVCQVRLFGVRCYKCHLAITEDEGLTFNKKPYHKDCFTCDRCLLKLEKQQFKPVENRVFCLRCYGDAFCKTCHSCGQPIVLSQNEFRFSYEDNSWHAECFTCHVCKRSLDNTPFSIRGSSLICKDCATEEDDTMVRISKARMSRYELPSIIDHDQEKGNSLSSQEDDVPPGAVQKSTRGEEGSPKTSTARRRSTKSPTRDSGKEPKE